MGTLEEKRIQDKIDELVQKMPNWQEHLTEFRKGHPELSPQEVMKKAGFTFRMKKGKLISKYVKTELRKILVDDLKNEALINY